MVLAASSILLQPSALSEQPPQVRKEAVMRVPRLLRGLALACGVAIAGAVTLGSARAQSDTELEALNQRVTELYSAGSNARVVSGRLRVGTTASAIAI